MLLDCDQDFGLIKGCNDSLADHRPGISALTYWQ